MPLGLSRQIRSRTRADATDRAAPDKGATSKHRSKVEKTVWNYIESTTGRPLISPDRARKYHSIPMDVAGESDFAQ